MKHKHGYSFIIITLHDDPIELSPVLDSIESQNIPPNQYQIVLVGAKYHRGLHQRYGTCYSPVLFDNKKFPVHITAKKKYRDFCS